MNGLQRAVSAEAMEEILVGLSRGEPLSLLEQDKVRSAARLADTFAPGTQVYPGSAARRTGLIIKGWACEVSILLDGRRQIHCIMLPGDPVFPRQARGRSCRTVIALTSVEVADISGLESDRDAPSLSRAMRSALVQREERLFSQITRLGRLSAYERVVHLLLELRDRLGLSGNAAQQDFPMPLTQEAMSDVLGLSVVHLNRTLQQLRREKLIDVRAGRVTLLRPGALAAIIGDDDWEDARTSDSQSIRGAWAIA